MGPGEFSEALVLRSVDYGEADRVVTLLTRRFGRVSVIARGARRSRRRFAGALSPLLLLNVELRRGRGELGVLAQAEVTRAYSRVLGALARMSAGFSALAFLRDLTVEHEPDHAVFATATGFLEALDAEQVASEELLVCFQARLLALLGYEPNLRSCGGCGKAAASGRAAHFDPSRGHLVCRQCGGASEYLGPVARERLRLSLSGDFVAAAWPAWPPSQRVRAAQALRCFAEQRLGRPLSALPIPVES